MKYKISKNIEITNVEDDGSVICFDIVSGATHILDEAGAAVVNTVGIGMSFDDAVDIIAKEFNVSANEIKDDVLNFTQELVDKEIIVEDN